MAKSRWVPIQWAEVESLCISVVLPQELIFSVCRRLHSANLIHAKPKRAVLWFFIDVCKQSAFVYL